MTALNRGRSGRRALRIGGVLLGALIVWMLTAGTALAAETTLTPVQQLQSGPVIAFDCLSCHGTIADATAGKDINFSHGAHMTYACTACHLRFPHMRGKTERVSMRQCYNCHALKHGPQGVIAKADCDTKCHTNDRSQRRPATHTSNWATTGHVAPAKAELSKTCMMCHTKAQCDGCHEAQRVSWETTATFAFDSNSGCLACHQSELPRLDAPFPTEKFELSAHRDATCQQCHPDFRYDDKRAPSKLWDVNAGIACSTSCHQHDKEAVAWRGSIHGVQVLSGKNSEAATCAGCHGGHQIEKTDTPDAKARMRAAGEQMCVAKCHVHDDTYASYNDWWHGAAYKRGAADAPACWTCHGSHDVRTAGDQKSTIYKANLGTTCSGGKEGTCHKDADASFAEKMRILPHGQVKAKAENPLAKIRPSLIFGGR